MVCLLTFLLLDQLVVEVLEVLKESDDTSLIIFITFILEAVVVNFKNFKIVAEPVEVQHSGIELLDLIASNRQHIQILESVETFKNRDAVLEEGEVLQKAQFFKPLYLFDHVEAEVQPFELCEALQTLDSRDDVVIKLELDEISHPNQVVNLDNVYKKFENGYQKYECNLLLKDKERCVSSQIILSSSSKIEFERLYSTMYSYMRASLITVGRTVSRFFSIFCFFLSWSWMCGRIDLCATAIVKDVYLNLYYK